ncbi:MAG: deoxyribose-phosphate aldolase [Candidatus Falkowbacteria bacterium]
MDKKQVAATIDSTNLKANASENDIAKLCADTVKYGFRGICVNLGRLQFAGGQLLNKKIAVVVDFPLGAGGLAAKMNQTIIAIGNGADEIDPVINLGAFRDKRLYVIKREIQEISRILPAKAIIETGHWNDREIAELAKLIADTGAFAVKTSTGMGPKVNLDDKARHVEIMKKAAPKLSVKAAGDIKTLADAIKMINAGADIIGTSSGAAMMEEEI